MNKTILTTTILAVLGGGAYFANSIIVDKVALEIASNAENIAHAYSDNNADIQVLKSDIKGSQVNQTFAIYFIDNGTRIDKPLYVNHSATISPFGYEVDGKLSLPKDKGLSEDIIKNVASFNEKINYKLKPSDESINLHSSLKLGVINVGYKSQLDIGEIVFSLNGTSENNSSKITLDSLNFTDRHENLRLGKVTIDTNVTPSLYSTNIDIANGGMLVKGGGLNIGHVQLKTEANIREKTTINFNWLANSIDLDSPDVTLLSTKLGVQGNIDGFKTKSLVSLFETIEKQDDNKTESLMKDILGDGLELQNIKIFMNDSSVTGNISLNKSNYTMLRPYEIQRQIEREINSDLNVTLTPNMASTLNIDKGILNQLFSINKEQNYTSEIKTALGKITVNGRTIN